MQKYYLACHELDFLLLSDDDSCPSTIKRAPQQKISAEEKRKRKTRLLKHGSNEYISANSSISSLGSTLSYCSATSDNDSEMTDCHVDPEELIDMINLHSQMNLPITESPLLLSCYSQHLSHYYCQVTSTDSFNYNIKNTEGLLISSSIDNFLSVFKK